MVNYECPICNYKSVRKNQYERHLLTKKHLNNTQQQLSGVFLTNSSLVQKVPHKLKEENFECCCGKIFSRKDNYMRHVSKYCLKNKQKQNEKVTKNYFINQDKHVCKYCYSQYSTKYNLNKHIKKCKQKNSQFINNNNNNNINNNINNNNISNNNQEYNQNLNHVINNNNSNVIDTNTENQNISNLKDVIQQLLQFLTTTKDTKHMNSLIKMIQENNIKNTELLLQQQDKMLELIKENKGNIIYNQTNNMSNTNYVFQFYNYSIADSMDSIKDKFRLSREEFIKASINGGGYRGALIEKATNVIIQPYLDYQNKRPIHTVDTARKKALYKDNHHDNWTLHPKTNLIHCFNVFHESAIEHQDKTIRENSKWLIDTPDDIIYRQTYFVPSDKKEREMIFHEVQNHIYKETKVKREIIIDNNQIILNQLEEEYEDEI